MADGGGEGAPARIGAYVLERRLGSGGMGVVHLARTVAGRQVAIKVIRREYAESEDFRARFRREVAAARRVSGAFTAPVVDADPDGDPPWLATLYVPGGSLTERIDREGPLTAREAARVGAELAEALLDIHRCGLVHRDLKPGNVLLAEDGVRVIDFGISRALADSHRLTEDGAVLGSPPFMAPEQLTGDGEATEAADVFALGAVVAYAVTGHSPFEAGRLPGGDPLAVAYRVVHEEPDLDDVPDSLRGLVSLCLAKDPEQRPEVSAVLRMAAFADTRAQAAVVRSSQVWQAGRQERDTGERGGANESASDRTPTAPGRRPRRLGRRLALTAVALATVGVVATVGLLNATGDDGGTEQPSAEGPADPAPDEAPAPFVPWEVDLYDWGIEDAATSGVRCEPAPERGVLCSAAGRLTIMLNEDGSERWLHRGPRDGVLGPGATLVDGAVITQSETGLAALDPDDGEPLWEIDAPELGHILAVGERALALRNGDSTVRFYAVDSPEPLGRWEVPGRYVTDLLSGGDRFLAVSREDESGFAPQMTLLSSAGAPVWPTPVPPPAEALGTLHPVGMDADAAYFEEWDADIPVINRVHRLDLTSRAWTSVELPEPTEPRTVMADGVIYASTMGGTVIAVDPAAGEVLWTVATAVETASLPAAVDGVLYLSDAEGALHRLSAADGSPLDTGEPHPGSPGIGSGGSAPPPAIGDGVAYVPTLGNTLYATPLNEAD
ncbi:protein kinase domain-containing protein [Streptomyces profundus]|uniref:protein kinase domain-containing protein n=1 Tax=Streptomyces profundus TaxID=2867410 RepID=UPI001D1656A4|nr:protein kinase [Streptomyces sp. MA3_2.13]UED85646.1 protein kinase [Streptomyces sp. MA3_2.13]